MALLYFEAQSGSYRTATPLLIEVLCPASPEAWAPANAGAHAEPLYKLFIKRTTTKALLLLFVRLAKMYRVSNSLVTGHTATDSAHYFASTVRWAQPTLVVRRPPAARSLAIAGR